MTGGQGVTVMRSFHGARHRHRMIFGLIALFIAIWFGVTRGPRLIAAGENAAGGSRAPANRVNVDSSLSVRAQALLELDRLSADEIAAIGQSLLASGQTTLGWSALVAASRIQPGHPGAIQGIAALHREMERYVAFVPQVDRLTAVPDGPALAEIVVGLVAFGSTAPANPAFDVTLDRLLSRKRQDLLKVTDMSAARKLLARVLLEEGRGTDALALLKRLPEDVDDAETHWLKSRAFLSQGLKESAAAELTRAGSFGDDNPMAPEPTPYVGAASCAKCHAQIYRRQQNSHHARTITLAAGLASVPLPPGPVTDPEDPKVTHTFHRDGNKIEVTAKVDDKVVKAIVDYAIGSGHHGVTMLARDASGHRALRMSYYADGTTWALTNPVSSRPVNREGFLGEQLSESAFRECLNCHSTRFNSESHPNRPEAADNGIGCERCHGPGEAHLKSVQSGFPQIAIAQPRIASHAERAALCAQCHRAQGSIPPSDPRFVRFQSSTLPYSRCVTESGGRLDCVTCHNPHGDVETRSAYYEAKCLACHAGTSTAAGKAKPEPTEDTVPAPVCSVNPRANCIECHMPKSTSSLAATPLTDHHIRIHPPPPSSTRTGSSR